METTIKVGDHVRHKTKNLNDRITLPMSVVKIDGQKAKCAFFQGSEQIDKHEWFLFEELRIIKYE